MLHISYTTDQRTHIVVIGSGTAPICYSPQKGNSVLAPGWAPPKPLGPIMAAMAIATAMLMGESETKLLVNELFGG